MKKKINIVVTGPESTGKSTLVKDLAGYYQAVFIPEYARTYVENLNKPYQFEDVEHIARTQVNEFYEIQNHSQNLIFFDTYLIITKVWFDVVYGKCPQWIVEKISENEIDLYLLCDTDLPWLPDSVRENGGEMRQKLFSKYQNELEYFGLNYSIIRGFGKVRTQNAIKAVEELLYKMKSFN